MSSPNHTALLEQLEQVIHLQKRGEEEQGLALLHSLIKQYPGHSRPYFILGLTLFKQDKLTEASHQLSRSIAINPAEAEYHTTLGSVLAKMGKKGLAQSRWKTAIQLNPDRPEPYFHMGDSLIDSGQPEKAIEFFKKAVQADPNFQEAWNNLGLCQMALRLLDESNESYAHAIAIDPENPDCHINLAMNLLIQKDFERGWEEYEWRLKRQLSTLSFPPPANTPRWQGEPLTGKTLLLICEQGFGDSLQFSRYFAVLKKSCKRLILQTPSPLAPLFQQLPELDAVDSRMDSQQLADYYTPLLSIPYLLKTTDQTIPSTFPYLQPNREKVAYWRQRIPQATLRIGLVWEGKSLFQNDPTRLRSTTLEALSGLNVAEGILFVSLQKGEPGRQTLSPPPGMTILNLDADIQDFSDTAAIITNLDLLISIDTATAHLGGALNHPTWVLLPFASDWRWGIEQTTSPWYPSLTLFRQERPNGWQEPIDKMANLLKRRLEP